MKKRVKLLFALCALVMAATALVGCGARLDYYYYTDEENYIVDMRLYVPNALETEIDRSSTVLMEPNNPEWKMTLGEWLSVFAKMFDYDMSDEVNGGNGSHYYRFVRKIPQDTEDDDDDEDSDTVVDVKNRFYTYLVSVTMPNPFNGIAAEYASDGGASASMVSVIKNGYGNLPPLLDAFPVLKGKSIEGIECNFLMPAIDGGDSSGETVTVDLTLPGEYESFKADFFKFSRMLDEQELTLTYSYTRPNPLGWYVTIILIAAAVVALILLLTRKKKPRPTPADTFPYDPGSTSGGGTGSLPTGYNGGAKGIDPFEGYPSPGGTSDPFGEEYKDDKSEKR